MKLELPAVLATPQALNNCLSELLHAQEAIRSHSLAKRTGASGRPVNTVRLSQVAGELLKDIEIPGQPSLTELGTAIEFLQEVRDQAPMVTIVLAAEVSEDKEQGLVSWFQRLAGRAVLCSIMVDPSIAGGVVVRTPRRMYDYSFTTLLRTQTDELRKELARG